MMGIYPASQNIISKGVIYICGRGLEHRPVIHLDLPKIFAEKVTKNDLLNSIVYILTIVKTFMFYPRKIENLIMVMNVENFKLGLTTLDDIQYVVKILLQSNPCCTHKILILNPN